jgi:hypothetical protein
VSASDPSPTITEVLRLEDLPLGSRGTRRAVVRWSDGSEGEALTWYADEILTCEGDLLGKTREQLRSLHFRRDRDWLRPSSVCISPRTCSPGGQRSLHHGSGQARGADADACGSSLADVGRRGFEALAPRVRCERALRSGRECRIRRNEQRAACAWLAA